MTVACRRSLVIGFLAVALLGCGAASVLPLKAARAAAAEEPVLSENFESGTLGSFYCSPDDRINLHALPAYPVRDGAQLNGVYSAHVGYRASGEYGVACMTAGYSFAAGTYAVTFRYSVEEGDAALIAKIVHRKNTDKNNIAAGFGSEGVVEDACNKTLSVTAEGENGVYCVVMTFEATTDYTKLQFTANGPCSYTVDDFALYAGEVVPEFPYVEKRSPEVTVVAETDFERTDDGCMATNFRETETGFGGAYTSDMSNKINGYYSKIIYSNALWMTDFYTLPDVLRPNGLYTVAFRFKAIDFNGYPFKENSLIIMGTQCSAASSLQKYIAVDREGQVQYFRSEGGKNIPWMFGIISLTVREAADGYKQLECVFETNNEEGYTFRMGFYESGAIVLDDLRIYSGNGTLALPAAEKKSTDDYPSVTLRGMRPTSGWVSVPVSFPRMSATNCPDGIKIEIGQPNGETETLIYRDGISFTPAQSGKHSVRVVATNQSGFSIWESFEFNVFPEPMVPTISLSEERRNACKGNTNEIVCLPKPVITDDKDNLAEVYVTGPNGFTSNDYYFIASDEGMYEVTYTAENAKGEKATLKFSFERTKKSSWFEGAEAAPDEIGELSDAQSGGCKGQGSVYGGLFFVLPVLFVVGVLLGKKRKDGDQR